MLTDRQQVTYRSIRQYHLRHGCSPKLTEMADGIGIRSKGVVHRYLKAIAEESSIDFLPGQHRGIRLAGDCMVDPATELIMPLIGKIAAGQPIEAIPDQNTYDLTDFFLGPNRFDLELFRVSLAAHKHLSSGHFLWPQGV